RDLPTRVRWLIAAQAVLAAAAMARFGALPAPGRWPFFLTLAALGLAAGAFKIELTARWGRLTMAFAVTFFTLLALGAGPAMAVNTFAAVGAVCLNQREGRRRLDLRGLFTYRLLFNAANYVLCVAAAESVFLRLGGDHGAARIQELAVPV